ncbi:endothelin-converting enzyme 1-like [Ornithodoros turicata]|uniref:endothelin-converting enzyme 1-like n=1 Tax=Ornithodoros turicata TaxID=34597 RepID=UPI0031395F8A
MSRSDELLVQGTGAPLLLEEEYGEGPGQGSSTTISLPALIFAIALSIAVAVTIGAFLYSNKERETPKEKGNTSLPGHISMPKFPMKPYDVSEEDYTDNDVGPAESTSPTYKKVCNTDDCQHVRKLIEAVVDTDRDPCDNFYKFACGRNQQLFPVVSDEHTNDLLKSIKQNLERAHIPPSRTTAFQKAAALYKHCRETDTEKFAKDARDFLGEHQMDLTKNMTFKPLDILVKFIFKIKIPMLFVLEPVEAGAQTFTFRKEVKTPRILQHADVASILPEVYSTPIDDKVVKTIRRLEKMFHAAGEMSQTSVNPISNSSVRVMELRKVAQEEGELSKDWLEALRRYAPPALRTKLIHTTEADLHLFYRLFGKQREVSENEMRVFFAWRAAFYFYVVLYGVFDCLQYTVQKLPNAVAHGASFKAGYDERIRAIEEMNEAIRSEIVKTFRTSSWLDDETREGAVEKVSSMRFSLGLAPRLNSSEKADEFYEELPDLSGPFVRDVLSIEEFLTERYWKGVEDDYRDYFYQVQSAVNTYDANAFYIPAANFAQMSIPLLLSPYFNMGGPPEVNYGSLGDTVAHEMMHGFDVNGRRYDGKGDITPWFTQKSTEEFKILERCYLEFINQTGGYGNYTVQKLEYQADVLSKGSLLRAYLKAAKKSQVHLGNVKGLTSDQIFYVATCLFYCADLFPAQPFATHPPKGQRCNLPLANSAHFSKTFSCGDGSPMNPPQKCSFW